MKKHTYLERTAEKIYEWIRTNGYLHTERIQTELCRLHRCGNSKQAAELLRSYYVELFQKILLIIGITAVVCMGILGLHALNQAEEIKLERADYGEEEESYVLNVRDANQNQTSVTVTVPAVRYSEQELKEQFRKGFAYLESVMYGDNKTSEEIRTNLQLETTIPDSGLEVSWCSEDYELLEDDGTVHNQYLTEPVELGLFLELKYEDETQEKEYRLKLYPGELTEQEQMERDVVQMISEQLETQAYSREIQLPKVLDAYYIEEPNQIRKTVVVLALLGILVCILLWARKREQIYRAGKKKRQRFQTEYPYLVHQMQLYMGAGTTIQEAFERTIRRCESEGKTTWEIYPELTQMQHEMQAGVTQETAYTDLGKRIGLPSYLKLTALLVRQLKTGESDVQNQLQAELQAAFTCRKEQAKKLGEEAGTRLLFPMILLMIISMAIIVLPAFQDFMF